MRVRGQKMERRSNERARVRKVGRIVSDNPRQIAPCIILDLSNTGALLLVHDQVPDAFELFYSAKRVLRDAVVVRRHKDMIGVRFESEPVVLEASDTLLQELRAS